MTTVAWNGKELVSDSRITKELAGDSNNVTFEDNFNHKLFSGEGYLIMGQPVQAIGFAGGVCALNEILHLGERARWFKLNLELSTLNPDQLVDVSPLVYANYNLIVVTADNVFAISSKPSDKVFTITQGPRSTFAAIGTGYCVAKDLLPVCTNARAFVTYASIYDKHTGGNYNVWDGTNFYTNVRRMSKVWAFIKVTVDAIRILSDRAMIQRASNKEASKT